MASVAVAAPTNYGLLTTVGIPTTSANTQPNGAFTSFDISYVDSRGIYYLADRSNAAVDIVNVATNKVIAQPGGFAGQQSATSISGPDGVVVVNSGTTSTLYAGDANSTLRSFNVTNPAAPVALGSVNTGGGALRLDEMAYSPATNQILAANNANTPAFASLINATPPTPTIAKGNILVPGQVAGGGLEQPLWNPTTGSFFVSVPTFNGTDAGGVQEFKADGTPGRTYNFSALDPTITGCSSAGLALGASGNLMVGCGTAGTQTVVLNPTGTGSIVAKLQAVSGSDELWYDPASGNFYVTGVNAAGDRVIDVYSDAGYSLLQSIDLTSLGAGKSNLHSVAVDPLSGNIFVPLAGTMGTFPDMLCPGGCVAVFAQNLQNVPEPASLPVLALTLAGFFGLTGWLRRRGQI